MLHVERADVPVWADETRWIQDPAVDQLLQAMLLTDVERASFSKRMKIAIGVKPELGGRVISRCELLARVTNGLEMTDGLWVIK